MYLGQLADMLSELAEAEQAVIECEHALGDGGNADTMRHKQQALKDARERVTELRAQSLPAAI